jgi:hypothetical protein
MRAGVKIKVGHPTPIFGEKQSHQVIENTEERPKIGQNKANLGHFSS